MSQFIHLTNDRGESRYSTLPQECFACMSRCNSSSKIVTCDLNKKKRRQGKEANKVGTAYLCSSEEDYLNSSKIFKYKLAFYLALVPEVRAIRESIREELNKETKRLIHNLTSLNAHNIQEVYSIVPQDALTKNIKKQLSTTKSYIDSNTSEAAAALLRIAKNNVSIRNEFSVFKKLYEVSPMLNRNYHSIHKVVLNVLHPFFNDFAANYIDVNVSASTERVYLDYESIHVALYHIIENASKYICPSSKMQISFKRTGNVLIILFDMVSLKIEDVDVDKIFEEGYSGVNAIATEKAGNGIGMNIMLRVLRLNGASLRIRRNVYPSCAKSVDGVPYENNYFEIELPVYG